MKLIQKRKGKGKTTKCLKRALKLIKKGYDVLFITTFSEAIASDIFYVFEHDIRKRHLGYTHVPSKKHIVFDNGADIRFMSYETYRDSPMKFKNSKIIVDDIDRLFGYKLDTISAGSEVRKLKCQRLIR